MLWDGTGPLCCFLLATESGQEQAGEPDADDLSRPGWVSMSKNDQVVLLKDLICWHWRFKHHWGRSCLTTFEIVTILNPTLCLYKEAWVIINAMFDRDCSLCLWQGWPVPVSGLQVEPEHLRIPADWTGSGTVTTGGQQSLTHWLIFLMCSTFLCLPLLFALITHLLLICSFVPPCHIFWFFSTHSVVLSSVSSQQTIYGCGKLQHIWAWILPAQKHHIHTEQPLQCYVILFYSALDPNCCSENFDAHRQVINLWRVFLHKLQNFPPHILHTIQHTVWTLCY